MLLKYKQKTDNISSLTNRSLQIVRYNYLIDVKFYFGKKPRKQNILLFSFLLDYFVPFTFTKIIYFTKVELLIERNPSFIPTVISIVLFKTSLLLHYFQQNYKLISSLPLLSSLGPAPIDDRDVADADHVDT
jgi:hypothetical protein